MSIAFSFADVSCTITGFGGIVSLGNGAAVAEEGITISQSEDKNTMTTGADGEVMHSLHASNAGEFVVRLLKTSAANQLLQLMYDQQRFIPAAWGQNVILLTHFASGDSISCRSAAFRRLPNMTYGKEGGIMEWPFMVGKIDRVLGSYNSPA